MTDELPPEVIQALKQKEKAQMKHNWMYSFMPLGTSIYLVGYCKNCDNGVSSKIFTDYSQPTKRETILTEMSIPKWGCVPPEGLEA